METRHAYLPRQDYSISWSSTTYITTACNVSVFTYHTSRPPESLTFIFRLIIFYVHGQNTQICHALCSHPTWNSLAFPHKTTTQGIALGQDQTQDPCQAKSPQLTSLNHLAFGKQTNKIKAHSLFSLLLYFLCQNGGQCLVTDSIKEMHQFSTSAWKHAMGDGRKSLRFCT